MKKYDVKLWNGVGYWLHTESVEASHEEEALEKTVAKIEKEEKDWLFFDDFEDLEKMEEEGLVLYVDATIEGASKPHWIDATNLRIEVVN